MIVTPTPIFSSSFCSASVLGEEIQREGGREEIQRGGEEIQREEGREHSLLFHKHSEREEIRREMYYHDVCEVSVDSAVSAVGFWHAAHVLADVGCDSYECI